MDVEVDVALLLLLLLLLKGCVGDSVVWGNEYIRPPLFLSKISNELFECMCECM